MIAKLALALAVSLVLSGCLPTIGRGGTSDQGTKVEEFAKGKVAGGFPNLPRYPKVQVIESIASSDSFGASFVTKDNLDKVLAFYNDSLPQFGWDVQFIKNSETNYIFRVKNDQHEGTITVNVAADGASTVITYSVSPR